MEGFAGVDALDDLLDGLVFDEQVANFNGVENLANQIRGGNFHAVEANAIGELVDLFEIETISGDRLHASELLGIFHGEFDLLGAQQFLLQQIERAVVEQAAVVDDHNAAAELFDVIEVVRGQQNGGLKFAIDGAQEFANLIFGDDVEADGGLVEEKQRWIMQQRGGQIATHALAERKLAHRCVQIILNAKDLIEFFHPLAEVAFGNFVNTTQELERFDDGDVPPELRALAEDDADGFHVLAALLVGKEAVDARLARAGHQNAREHFDAGGFAGAVWPDVADHFAALDFETDFVDGADGQIIADKKILDRAPNAFAAAKGSKVFRECADIYE